MTWRKNEGSGGSSPTAVTKGTNGKIFVNGVEMLVYDDSGIRSLIDSSGGSSDSSGLFESYQNLWIEKTGELVNGDGSISVSASAKSIDFTLVESETSYVSNAIKTIYCYNENKQFISSVTTSINNTSSFFAPRVFVTPANTKYIRANRSGILNASSGIILIKGNESTLPVNFQYVGNDPVPPKYMLDPNDIYFFFKNDVFGRSLRFQTSPLWGLKINFLGDSITNGHWTNDDGNEVITYHEFLSKKYNLKANNYGYAGSGFANYWNTSNAYFQRSLTMDTDVDLNIVWGGFNDRQQPLGVFGDTWSDSAPTIYGAIDQLIKNLNSRFPNTPTVFLIHFANDEFTTPINNAVKNMCNLHRIPFIDLSKTILSNNYDRTTLEQYFRASDWNTTGTQGIHPNTDGYKVLTRFLAKELERTLDYL